MDPSHFWHLLKLATAFGPNINQLSEVVEVTIGQRLIGQLPQTFSWLSFGRIRREKQQMQFRWHHYALAALPA